MQARLTDFRAVLFDMDGTIYRVSQPLPAVNEVLTHVRRAGAAAACMTNNSANTPQELADRLHQMGIAFDAADIHTAAHAMADYILSRWPLPRAFNFAGAALPAALGEAATWVHSPLDGCDVVAVGTHGRHYGHGPGFDQERAAVAMQLLRRGAQLVVGCADRVFPTPDGLEIGSGSWGALFTYAANLSTERVHYAGKPTIRFFQMICQRLGVEPSRCLLIGDNLESDIGGGLDAGMTTALVLTGVTHRQDLATAAVRPHLIFDDLPHLLREMA